MRYAPVDSGRPLRTMNRIDRGKSTKAKLVFFHHLRVLDIGGGGDEAVDRPTCPVHPGMDLHADGVLVSLLRGGWGVDYGGIHDGSFRESQSFLLDVGVDFLKDSHAREDGGTCRWWSRRGQVRSRGRSRRSASWIPCRRGLLPQRSSLSESSSAGTGF